MGRWYDAVATDPARVQALTSVTVEEFADLVVPFEAAFQERMAEWTLEGKRRKNRRYTPYANSPLPTAEDRLFFILSYLKENPTQTYHGYLFDLPQCKVNQWVHTLFPVLRTALRWMGAAPARTFAEVLARLEVATVPDAAAPLPSDPPPPLFVTTGPNGPSRAPTTRLNKGATIAARSASIR